MLIKLFEKIFFLSLIVSLNSCCISMSHSQQTQNLIPQPSIDCSLVDATEDSFLTTKIGAWPTARWWEIFQSDELNHLEDIALTQNYSIAQLIERMEIAKQEALIARSRLFPLIYFKAQDAWEHFSKNGIYRALNPHLPLNGNLIDLSLTFNYELDFWGKNRNLFQAALGEEIARLIEIYQTQLMITTAVAQVYFALKTNFLRERLYTSYYDIKKRIYDLQNYNRSQAIQSKLPQLVSEERVLEAHQLLLSVQDEIKRDRHLLNQLLGLGPDCELIISGEIKESPQKIDIPCNLSSGLLARRPDLMAQIWRVKALAHQVGAAMADYYPDVNLMALIGLESTTFAKLFRSGSETALLQPALSLPIFTAGAIRANVMAHKAEFDEAVFAYDDLVLKSAQEIADLLSIAKKIDLQIKDQETIIKDQKQIYQILLHRKNSGLDSIFPFYDIDASVIEEELNYANLQYDKLVAIIKLIKALGGGFEACCIPLEAVCIP